MKKLLGIVSLALLWCNITFAKIIELDQGVKIKIPDGYEYVQFKRLEFFRGKQASGVNYLKVNLITT